MRINLLLLLILVSPMALAQDCVNCSAQEIVVEGRRYPWPLELIEIEHVDLPRSSRASFCRRPTEMLDTIVIHHTAGNETRTPQDINRLHMNQGSPSDPWLMAGYTYFVNSSYGGNNNIRPRVTEGRPIDIVGAHAGSDIFMPMNKQQKELWDKGAVTCGREGGRFTVDPSLVRNGQIKANVSTIGVAVIGNYAPFSRRNPSGYSRRHPRYPTTQTLMMLGRLSCQLQRQYPNLKSIKWHSYYHSTECPGTIKNYINQIKTIAGGLGCEFN